MEPSTTVPDKLSAYLSFYRRKLLMTEALMKSLQQTIERKKQRLGVLKYRLQQLTASQPPIKQLEPLESVTLNPRGRSLATHLVLDGALRTCYSVGYLGVSYNAFKKRFESPRQPFIAHARDEVTQIFFTDRGWEKLLQLLGPDITRTERVQGSAAHTLQVYLLLHTHFNRNHTFRCYIMPPRQTHRVGLFSTRSPHRINPLGLSIVRVESLDGQTRCLTVAGSDLLNGTPIVAVQLYKLEIHDHPTAKAGWLDTDTLYPLYYDTQTSTGRGARESFVPGWEVAPISPEIREKLDFIQKATVVDVYSMILTHCSHRPILSRTHKQKEAKLDNTVNAVLAVSLYRVSYVVDTSKHLVTLVDVQPSLKREQVEEVREFDPEAEEVYLFFKKFSSEANEQFTVPTPPSR